MKRGQRTEREAEERMKRVKDERSGETRERDETQIQKVLTS